MNRTAPLCPRALCAVMASALVLVLPACEQKPAANLFGGAVGPANDQKGERQPDQAGVVREQRRPQPPAPDSLDVAQARAQPEPATSPPPQATDTPEPRRTLPKSPPAAGKPAPVNRPVSDAELAAKVKSAVLAEPLTALMFNVNVSNGVVTLSGTADTPATRDRAVRAASGVEGVKSVNNRIAILSGP